MHSIQSPDGRLTVRLLLAPISPRLPDCVHLEAAYDGRPVLLPSVLGLRMVGSAASLLAHLRVMDMSHDEHSSRWRPVCGERAEVVDHYREVTVDVEETIPPGRRFRVAVRVYNEGLAFRYEFLADCGMTNFVIGEELTRFALPEGCEGYVCRWAQGPYERMPIPAIGEGAERPLTIAYPDGLFCAIGEAGNRYAFENVFVYNADDGSLEVFAQGGKKVWEPLQCAFCKAVLGRAIDPADPLRPTFVLDHLLTPDAPLPLEAGDGVEEARITRMRVVPRGCSGYIEVKADPKGSRNDIYRKLERWVSPALMTSEGARVASASFSLRFAHDGPGRPPTLSFDVSAPNSSNLKSKPDEQRLVGERCLKRWGVTDDE